MKVFALSAILVLSAISTPVFAHSDKCTIFKPCEGQQGPKGDKGDRGEQGIQGEQGLKGDTGSAGINGKDGLNGKDGIDGKDGLNGKDGIDGEQGARGEKGDSGADGKKGETGLTGAAGLNGVDGLNGKNGKDADMSAVNANAKSIKALEQSTNKRFASLQKQVDRNRDHASAGISGVAAMANIPQVSQGSAFSVGAGVGAYDGESALAVGVSARFNENVVTKASVAMTSESDAVLGAGVSYEW